MVVQELEGYAPQGAPERAGQARARRWPGGLRWPGGRGRPGGRWWPRGRLGAALALVVGLVLAAGLVALRPVQWFPINGDHYYYTSAALQFAGYSYDRSLELTGEYFNYVFYSGGRNPYRLDFGFLDPQIAPLIYPRVVLSLLAAPAISWLGIRGVYVPGLVLGTVCLVVLMVLARRRIGTLAMAAIAPLTFGTVYATSFLFGVYSEVPLALAAALMLVAFPLGRARRGWWAAVAAAALVPIMLLSRQAPVLPVGMVLGGWLWTWVGSRRLRNPWLPFVATVIPSTVVSYLVITAWAPYSPLWMLYRWTNTTTLPDLIRAMPAMWRKSMATDLSYTWTNDPGFYLFFALVVFGFVVARRSAMAGVLAGSLLYGVTTFALNGQPNQFRYLSPALPVMILVAAIAVTRLVAWARRRPWWVPELALPCSVIAAPTSGLEVASSDPLIVVATDPGGIRVEPAVVPAPGVVAAAAEGGGAEVPVVAAADRDGSGATAVGDARAADAADAADAAADEGADAPVDGSGAGSGAGPGADDPPGATSPVPDKGNSAGLRWGRTGRAVWAATGWPALLAAAAWMTVAALLGATALTHETAPLRGAPRLYLHPEVWPHPWPFPETSGVLTCAGSDFQVWFIASNGRRYAVSGTAMAASLFNPRINVAFAPYEDPLETLAPLLNAAMPLCEHGRTFRKSATWHNTPPR